MPMEVDAGCLPLEETCNGLDDDCDGIIDESGPDLGGPCATGALGQCAQGRQVCRDGAVICEQTNQPIDELCNGLDDDCDGRNDETPENEGAAATPTLGVCAAIEQRCVDGRFVCMTTQAGAEAAALMMTVMAH